MKKTTLIKRITLVFLSVVMVVCCIPFSASAASANAKTIYEFCIKELKLNNAGACGVLANIEAESNFNPNLYGDGGDSYGICQWNLSRFDNLISFCNKNGYNWKTLNGQLYFLIGYSDSFFVHIIISVFLGAYNFIFSQSLLSVKVIILPANFLPSFAGFAIIVIELFTILNSPASIRTSIHIT